VIMVKQMRTVTMLSAILIEIFFSFLAQLLLMMRIIHKKKLEELMPMCEEIKTTLLMDEVKEFAEKILKLGEEYKVEKIIKYGKELIGYAETFKIDKVMEILSKYSENII